MSHGAGDSSGGAGTGTRARQRMYTPASGSRRLSELTTADLLAAALSGCGLPAVVPLVLERLEADPLASAGWFAGDLLRGLLEVPASFWARHPRLYARFRECLRAGAMARRGLPPDERAHFWTAVLPAPERRFVHLVVDERDDEPSSDG